MGILDGITGVASAGAGIANTVLGFKNYEYQKDMQQEAWNREDTAVQRRMADLQAAGLSKTLAAGQGASSSAPMRLDAPQISDGIAEAIPKAVSTAAAVTQMMRQKADIAKTQADIKNVEAQTSKAQAETEFMKSNNPQRIASADLDLQTKTRTLDNVVKSLDLDVQRKGFEQTQQDLTRRLNQAKVSDAEWGNTLQLLKKNALVQGMDRVKQEMVAKDLTIEFQKLMNEQSRYNIDWYKGVGLPTNNSTPYPVTMTEFIKKRIEDMRKLNAPAPPAKKNSDSVTKG